MQTSKITIDISVKDIDLFKNLVSLLEKHFDDLPEELPNSLKDIAEYGINDFVATDFMQSVEDFNTELVETDFKTSKISSINRTLKRVEYFDEELSSHKVGFPETFYLKYDGKTIIEW